MGAVEMKPWGHVWVDKRRTPNAWGRRSYGRWLCIRCNNSSVYRLKAERFSCKAAPPLRTSVDLLPLVPSETIGACD